MALPPQIKSTSFHTRINDILDGIYLGKPQRILDEIARQQALLASLADEVNSYRLSKMSSSFLDPVSQAKARWRAKHIDITDEEIENKSTERFIKEILKKIEVMELDYLSKTPVDQIKIDTYIDSSFKTRISTILKN